MSDPLQNVTPGQPLRFRADSINAWNAAARNDRKRRAGGPTAGAITDELTPSVTVLVRNDTGGTLGWPGVLALGDSIVSAVDRPHDVQDRPLFEGGAPAGASDPFALLTEPLADGKIGVGVVAGVAVCEVGVSDTDHEYAEPAAGVTLRLVSAARGPARILWREAGTGFKRAVVLLGQVGGGGSSPAACRTWGWVAGLETSWCLKLTGVSANGRCGDIDLSQRLYLAWDAGDSRWESGDDAAGTPEDDFTHGLGIGPAHFWVADGRPRLTIDGVEGVLECGGEFWLVYAFGGPVLCDGTPVTCDDNVFRVLLECVACPEAADFACPTTDPPDIEYLPAALVMRVEQSVPGGYCDDDWPDGQVSALTYDANSTTETPGYSFSGNFTFPYTDDFLLSYGCSNISNVASWGYQFGGGLANFGSLELRSLSPFCAVIDAPVAQTQGSPAFGFGCDGLPAITPPGDTDLAAWGLMKLVIVEEAGQAETPPCHPDGPGGDELLLRVFAGGSAGDYVGTYDAMNDWWEFSDAGLFGGAPVYVYLVPAVAGVVGTTQGNPASWAWSGGGTTATMISVVMCEPSGFTTYFQETGGGTAFGGKSVRVSLNP